MQRKKHKLEALITLLGSGDIKSAQLNRSKSVSVLALGFCAPRNGSSLRSTPGAAPLPPVGAACLVQTPCRNAGLAFSGAVHLSALRYREQQNRVANAARTYHASKYSLKYVMKRKKGLHSSTQKEHKHSS